MFADIGAGGRRGAGKGGAEQARIGLAVAGAPGGADGGIAEPWIARDQGVAADHLDGAAVCLLGFGMSRHGDHIVLVAGHFEVAGDGIFAVVSDQFRQAVPDVNGARGKLEFGQGAAVAPHAAEIHAARRRPGLALFEQYHRHTAQRDMKGGGAADDAAADDGDFGLDAAHIEAARSGSSSAASPPIPMCSGLIGAWPRRRPTSAKLMPLRWARISAAAMPHMRPWQRPMPSRV